MGEISIGIVGETKEIAMTRLREMTDELDHSIIKQVTKDRIILNDGGRIIALALLQSARGYRFHEVYISKSIMYSQEVYETIIPCLRPRQYFDGNKVYYEGGFLNWNWRNHVRYF